MTIKNTVNKTFTFIVILAFCVGLIGSAVPAIASGNPNDAANNLHTLGLFRGVGINADGRYFTAETDIINKEYLFFCEVTTSGRGTLGLMKFEKADFVNAANIVISKNN